jgi:release factor glutamine methyltransferase
VVKKYSELYLDARKALLPTEGEQASLLARNLVCHASGKTPEEFIAHREKYASDAIGNAVEEGVARLLEGEPLAYVLESWEFYGMELYINRSVLIPRDDTCAVAGLAMKKALFLDQDPRILDLCTGSGCIGLAVANRVKDARVTLADVSREALAVARKNVTKQKLGSRVSCVQVDALQPAPGFLGEFDMIISNPPYITTQEMEQLPGSVRDYEPHLALHGGADGLDFYRAIVRNFTPALKPGGYLCFEFGMGQGDSVCAILEHAGYEICDRVQDFNERERAVLARKSREDS